MPFGRASDFLLRPKPQIEAHQLLLRSLLLRGEQEGNA